MYNIVLLLISTLRFLNCVHSQNVSYHATATNLKRDFQNDLFHANFISEKSRYLNVSSIGVELVEDSLECGQSCVQTPPCFSFNLASSPDVDRKLRCKLLPTDKFNSSDKLQVSKHFNHYSIKSVCDTTPCRNGGRCVAKYEEDDFSCSCVPGYEGRYYETDINECSSNPCQNGGSCGSQVNRYVCSCAVGFAGDQCETNINECSSNPCQNGGTCTDQVNGYVCSCVAGFSGNQCETVAAGSCPDGWTSFESKCFLLVTARHNWPGARSNCQSLGGDLVVIDTSDKQEFIKSFLTAEAPSSYSWAGGYPDSGVWRWVNTNEPVNNGPTFCAANEPHSYQINHLCLGYSAQNFGKWYDCSGSLLSVCEKGS